MFLLIIVVLLMCISVDCVHARAPVVAVLAAGATASCVCVAVVCLLCLLPLVPRKYWTLCGACWTAMPRLMLPGSMFASFRPAALPLLYCYWVGSLGFDFSGSPHVSV